MLDINLHLIIAQVITFLVGLFLLWLVAYKPIMAIFRQRADKIKQDLDAAEEARLKMEAVKSQYDKEIAGLEEKAQQIIQQAARDGQQVRADILKEARAQSQEIIRQAEERIGIEKEKALKDLRQEVVNLSMLVSEKVIGATVNPELQQRFVNQTLDQIERKSQLCRRTS